MSEIVSQSVGHSSNAQQAEVVQEEFLHYMTAMQQGYQTLDPTSPLSARLYPLPADLTNMMPRVSADGTKPAAQETQRSVERVLTDAELAAFGVPVSAAQLMTGTLHDQHQKMLAFIDTHRNAILHAIATAKSNSTINAATKQAGEDHNLDKFKADMEVQRQKAGFRQQMNVLRNRAKVDHNTRINALFARLIAIGTAHPLARREALQTGNVVGKFLTGVLVGAVNLVGTVESAEAAVGSVIGKAAEAVGNWASEAAKSVVHFFGF